MKIKLIDVANAAGVSVSTVSRVINGDRERPASQATVDKIWTIVKELGYVPNQNAKNLVTGSKEKAEHMGKIGCIYTSTYDLNNDPFFSCIGIGIQTEMNQQPYNLDYTLSAANMDYKELYVYIVNNPVDGVIVLGRFDESILHILKEHFNHLVYAGVNEVNAGFDEVICDGYEGAKAAINHLKSMGHQEIGYVGYTPNYDSNNNLVNEHRYRAYEDMMKEDGRDIDKCFIVHTRLRTTTAYDAMKIKLENLVGGKVPSALFCANDATAFGVMKALQEKGYRIPEEVAIIGLDNVEMASYVTPKLSSISVPRRELGSQAVKILIDQIENKRTFPIKMNLPFKLVVRESSDWEVNKILTKER